MSWWDDLVNWFNSLLRPLFESWGLDRVDSNVTQVRSTTDRIDLTTMQLDGTIGIIDGKVVQVWIDTKTNQYVLVAVERDQAYLIGDVANMKVTSAMFQTEALYAFRDARTLSTTLDLKVDHRPTREELDQHFQTINYNTTNNFNQVLNQLAGLWPAWLTAAFFADILTVSRWFLDLATGKAVDAFYQAHPEVRRD